MRTRCEVNRLREIEGFHSEVVVSFCRLEIADKTLIIIIAGFKAWQCVECWVRSFRVIRKSFVISNRNWKLNFMTTWWWWRRRLGYPILDYFFAHKSFDKGTSSRQKENPFCIEKKIKNWSTFLCNVRRRKERETCVVNFQFILLWFSIVNRHSLSYWIGWKEKRRRSKLNETFCSLNFLSDNWNDDVVVCRK